MNNRTAAIVDGETRSFKEYQKIQIPKELINAKDRYVTSSNINIGKNREKTEYINITDIKSKNYNDNAYREIADSIKSLDRSKYSEEEMMSIMLNEVEETVRNILVRVKLCNPNEFEECVDKHRSLRRDSIDTLVKVYLHLIKTLFNSRSKDICCSIERMTAEMYPEYIEGDIYIEEVDTETGEITTKFVLEEKMFSSKAKNAMQGVKRALSKLKAMGLINIHDYACSDKHAKSVREGKLNNNHAYEIIPLSTFSCAYMDEYQLAKAFAEKEKNAKEPKKNNYKDLFAKYTDSYIISKQRWGYERKSPKKQVLTPKAKTPMCEEELFRPRAIAWYKEYMRTKNKERVKLEKRLHQRRKTVYIKECDSTNDVPKSINFETSILADLCTITRYRRTKDAMIEWFMSLTKQISPNAKRVDRIRFIALNFRTLAQTFANIHTSYRPTIDLTKELTFDKTAKFIDTVSPSDDIIDEFNSIYGNNKELIKKITREWRERTFALCVENTYKFDKELLTDLFGDSFLTVYRNKLESGKYVPWYTIEKLKKEALEKAEKQRFNVKKKSHNQSKKNKRKNTNKNNFKGIESINKMVNKMWTEQTNENGKTVMFIPNLFV